MAPYHGGPRHWQGILPRSCSDLVYAASMFNMRPAVSMVALASSVAAMACAKSKGPPSSEPAAEPAQASEPAAAAPPVAKPAVPKIQVTASLEGLGDMMDAASVISKNVDPEAPIDVRAQVGALLLASGFGPGFLANIALDAVHSVALAFPPGEQQSPSDIEFAGAFGVLDARKVLESMPASFKPQPLGAGGWEIRFEQMTLFLKEAGQELQLGLSAADLARANALERQPSPNRRIRARAENIPPDLLDIDEIPGVNEVPGLRKVLEGAKSVEVEFDFGTARPAQVLAAAQAPFSSLGLEPIGVPRGAATALEQRLPERPFLAASMSWGDPSLLHASIDRLVPLDQIPEPFAAIVRQSITGVHGLLDQISNDVVVGLYVGPKGEAAAVIAADVKSDADTMTGVRSIEDALIKTIEAHAVMQGKNEAAKFTVEYKENGASFGAVKADRLAVKVPKDFRDDFDDVETFLKKDTLEVISFVHEGIAVLAVGAGARALAAQVAKPASKTKTTSLGQDSGLQGIRTAMGGCQLCASFDITEYLRFRLHLLRAQTEDKAELKKSKAMLSDLAKVKVTEKPSLGVRVEPERGSLALHVPQPLMFTGHEELEVLQEINAYVDAGGTPVPPPAPPAE